MSLNIVVYMLYIKLTLNTFNVSINYLIETSA